MSKSTRGQRRIFSIFSIFGAAVMTLAPQGSAEGPPTVAQDINPMPLPAASSFPSELAEASGLVFFTATEGPNAIKIRSADGGGTSLLKDTSASLPGNSKRMAAAGSQASTLSVRVMGSGTVASDPPGIDCPADCVEDYGLGAVVTLTATPAPGWSFAGWSGVCRGNDFCVIDMTFDFKSVMATFRPSDGVPRR